METNEPEELQKRSKLPIALGIAAVVAIIMTIISVAIYNIAGFYKLDLSRPGYEIEREDVFSNEATQSYDSTSPLSAKALSEVLAEFDERVSNLNGYGDFSNDALSDTNVLTGQ